MKCPACRSQGQQRRERAHHPLNLARRPGHWSVLPSLHSVDDVKAQTFVARVANSFPLHSRRPHLLRRSQHLRLGAAAGWSRRTGAAHEEEGMRFGSRSTKSVRVFRLHASLIHRPGAARGFTYLAETPTYRPMTLLSRCRSPAWYQHESPFALHRRTPLPSHAIQAEQGRRRSLYINWNAYPLSLFELVSMDGGQVD
ncbi:hypothetical protein EDB86DRAFT_1549589 [Lactarius hatsudake]|nr:hypothetical protein EDB86DRAFT_1549589 [Lactarius hatsudake]